MKYKIWAQVYQGSGNYDEEERIIELANGLNEKAVDEETNLVLWELLSLLGVETSVEKVED